MDTDPALRPVEVEHTPGERYRSGGRTWQGIPGIERTGDGRLWVTWYSGGDGEGPENYVLLVGSDDGGGSWSEPRLAIDPPGHVRAFDPCLWVDPLGRLHLFWAQENVKWDGRAGVWTTTRRDGNWSGPRRLCDGIMMNKPTVLQNGDWIYPATRWDLRPQVRGYRDTLGLSGDDIDRLTTPVDAGSVPTTVYRSRDYGQSVQRLGGPQVPGSQWSPNEHTVVEREDGRLWMLVRTSYGIGESFSSDGGHSWTPVRDSGIEHPASRFFVRRLGSGALLLVKHASATERTGLVAFLSTDDGQSWKGGFAIEDRESVSYPDAVQDPDGRIWLVYDHDRYGVGEILVATFREADVAAGEAVTDSVRRRVPVDSVGE